MCHTRKQTDITCWVTYTYISIQTIPQIIFSSCRYVVTSIGMRLTDEQIDDMIRIADKDGDGDISYVEFIKLMTSKWIELVNFFKGGGLETKCKNQIK